MITTLSVLHEGWGAAMPNLDMMATVVMQTQEVMPGQVRRQQSRRCQHMRCDTCAKTHVRHNVL